MFKILLIEDNLWVIKSLQQVADPARYWIEAVTTLQAGYDFFRHEHCNLCVIDRRLPDGDGVEIVEFLHQTQPKLPLLILSEVSGLADRINGLERGADDYMAKPFSTAEVFLRIDNLLAKTKNTQTTYYQAGQIRVFPEQGVTRVRDRQLNLRKREFQILAFLIRHKNQMVTRDMIINHVWAEDEAPTDDTVDVYVRRIRQQLPKGDKILHTVRGYGYLVKDSVECARGP